jgi:hypothetical protein
MPIPVPEIPSAMRTRAAAVVMGARLGWMSPAQIRAHTARYYDSRIDGHIDYAEAQHNCSGLQEWESDALAWFPRHGRVLVYAAGAGREVLALTALGYDVVAFECNVRLVAAGNALLAGEGIAERIAQLPADTPPPHQGPPYDAVVIGWSSYAHIQTRGARLRLLRALREQSRMDARLLLSFFVRTHEEFHFDIVADVGSALRRLRRREPVELGDVLGHTFVHMFSRRELRAELRDADWELLRYSTSSVAHAVAGAR